MNHCIRCTKKWNLPKSGNSRYGECWICEGMDLCHNTPFSKVPDPTGILFREGRPNDA